MSMLAELVEVVIGVDTHSETHTVAVVDARTGGVLARATVSADPDGYAELSALGEAHSVSWSSSWTVLSGLRGGRERSPIRSTLSGPPATRWPVASWPSPRPAHSGLRCRCG